MTKLNRIKKFAEILITLFLVTIIFTACENLFEGMNYKQQIENFITDLNAPDVKVRIRSVEGEGTTSPNGEEEFKVNREQALWFEESKLYAFQKWIVVDAETEKEIDSSYIKIKNIYSKDTTFTVLKEMNAGVTPWIKPVCTPRPGSELCEPQYDNNGSPYDSNISITFTNPMDRNSFYFTKQELYELGVDVENLKDLQKVLYLTDSETGKFIDINYEIIADDDPELASKKVIYGYTDVSLQTYFKNIEIKNKAGNSVAEYFCNPKVYEKVLTISGITDEPVPLAADGFENISVVISPDVCDSDGIPLGSNNPAWTYKINGSTTRELPPVKIDACVSDVKHGSVTISPVSVNNEYAVGTAVKIFYTESKGYSFQNWKVSYDTIDGTECSAVMIGDSNAASTTAVINRIPKAYENSTIKIYPVVAKRPAIKSRIPEYREEGVNKDSAIEIVFDDDIDESNFFFSEADLSFISYDGKGSENEPGLLTVTEGEKTKVYGYVENGNTYFKNISISSSYGESFNQSYGYLHYEQNEGENHAVTTKLRLLARRDRLIPVDDNNKVNVYVTIKKDVPNKEGVTLGASEDTTFSFKLNSKVDDKAPEVKTLIVAKNKELFDAGTYFDRTVTSENNSLYTQDYYTNSIYVYCKGSDTGSGLYSVSVKETLCYTSDGKTANASPMEFFTAEGMFPVTIDGVSEAEFGYDIQTKTSGVVKLEFSLYDYTGNSVASDTYYVICDKDQNFENLRIYNALSPDGITASNGCYLEISDFNLTPESLNEKLRTVYWTEPVHIWAVNPNLKESNPDAANKYTPFETFTVNWTMLDSNGNEISTEEETVSKTANYKKASGKTFGLWSYTIPSEKFTEGADYKITISTTDFAGKKYSGYSYLPGTQVEFRGYQIDPSITTTKILSGKEEIDVPACRILLPLNIKEMLPVTYRTDNVLTASAFYRYFIYYRKEGETKLSLLGVYGDGTAMDENTNDTSIVIPSIKGANEPAEFGKYIFYIQPCYYKTESIASVTVPEKNNGNAVYYDYNSFETHNTFNAAAIIKENNLDELLYDYLKYDSVLFGSLTEAFTVIPRSADQTGAGGTNTPSVRIIEKSIDVEGYKNTGKCKLTMNIEAENISFDYNNYCSIKLKLGPSNEITGYSGTVEFIESKNSPGTYTASITAEIPCPGNRIYEEYIDPDTGNYFPITGAIIIPSFYRVEKTSGEYSTFTNPQEFRMPPEYDTAPPAVSVGILPYETKKGILIKDEGVGFFNESNQGSQGSMGVSNEVAHIKYYWEKDDGTSTVKTPEQIKAIKNYCSATFSSQNTSDGYYGIAFDESNFAPEVYYNIYVEVKDLNDNETCSYAGVYVNHILEINGFSAEIKTISEETVKKAVESAATINSFNNITEWDNPDIINTYIATIEAEDYKVPSFMDLLLSASEPDAYLEVKIPHEPGYDLIDSLTVEYNEYYSWSSQYISDYISSEFREFVDKDGKTVSSDELKTNPDKVAYTIFKIFPFRRIDKTDVIYEGKTYGQVCNVENLYEAYIRIKASARNIYMDEYYSTKYIYFPVIDGSFTGSERNNFEERPVLVNMHEGLNGWTIETDSLCFVHTMRSPSNYGSSVEDWETKGLESDVKIFSGEKERGGAFVYKNDLNKIENGNYYTVIAHFADGTTLITPVKQKQ